MSSPTSNAPADDYPLIVDTTSTRYDVVRTGAALAGWVCLGGNDNSSEESDDAKKKPPRTPVVSAVWLDKSVLPARVAGLPAHQRLNHFVGMAAVARKAVLFRRLMRARALCRRRASGSTAAPPTTAEVSSSSPPAAGASSGPQLLLDALSFAPQSFSARSDAAALDSYVERHRAASHTAPPPFYILKPNRGCEGRGIRLTPDPVAALREMAAADAAVAAATATREAKMLAASPPSSPKPSAAAAIGDDVLVQRYVDDPMLIDGKKFDLRLYALLVSAAAPGSAARPAAAVEDFGLFLYREGLVRLCAADYAPPTADNCGERSVHLTNYAVNKRCAAYHIAEPGAHEGGSGGGDHDDSAGDGQDTGYKRDLRFLARHIDSGAAGPHLAGRWGDIRRRIDACVALTILSGGDVLRRELLGAGAARGHRADGRGCFELLGFDVMLTAGGAPVLLEVNHSPSLFCESAFDAAVKSALLRDTFALLATHLPPPAAHRGDARRYAELMAAGAADMRAAEDALGREECAANGFVRLLPEYGRAGSGGGWTAEERLAQECMLGISRELR